jgi:hypothetical protein
LSKRRGEKMTPRVECVEGIAEERILDILCYLFVPRCDFGCHS